MSNDSDDFPLVWDEETWAAVQWVIETSKVQDHWDAMTNRSNALTAMVPPTCPIYRPILAKTLHVLPEGTE